MIKVSDFIFQHLVEKHGIHHCFLVTGGGAMHLNDSIGHTEGLKYICNHHEQASAMFGNDDYSGSIAALGWRYGGDSHQRGDGLQRRLSGWPCLRLGGIV